MTEARPLSAWLRLVLEEVRRREDERAPAEDERPLDAPDEPGQSRNAGGPQAGR